MTTRASDPLASLFHFSDAADMRVFEPRALRVPVDRGPSRAWLNGPLVWAIDADHSLLYLFPRDCPRIVLWPVAGTTPEDEQAWFGDATGRAIAYVEEAWRTRIETGLIHRYRMPPETFEPLGEVGTWVSRERVAVGPPETLHDLPAAMASAALELRFVPRLTPLGRIWRTSLHATGLRLRNAQDWVAPENGPPRPMTQPS